MSLNRTIRNFIIGKDHYVPSLLIFRNALLRGQVALLTFFIGLYYIITDSYFGVLDNMYLYGVVMTGAGISFLLNRNEYYQSSTIVLLTMANGVVFAITSTEGVLGGVHVFFIAIGMAAMTLFGFKRIKLAVIFVGISYVLFLIAFIYKIPFLGKPNFTPEYQHMSSIVNFTASLIACTLGIYFILQINYKSENALKGNQAKLFRISDELKQSQERLETAIKGSKAGIYEWSVPDNKVYLSAYWKELLGYDHTELNDFSLENFTELLHPDDRESTSKLIDESLANLSTYQSELRLKTKTGEYKWFYDSGLCKPGKNGEPYLVVGSIIDISDRKQSEKQIVQQNELLAKANEELDRFVYSASHDLRAPLSSLLGLISIAERTDNAEEIQKCFNMMRDRVNTMDGFIREITDYSRNARLEVSVEPVPLHSMVNGIVENLKYLKNTDAIAIYNDIPPDLLINSDMARLRVVLNNLIANALKYHDLTKKDPFIRVTALGDQKKLFTFIIEDNGQGISQEHQSKIFNMFYRASENSDGSGLGLYIVRETLEKLSGSIHVKSDLGIGSTFIVSLPQ